MKWMIAYDSGSDIRKLKCCHNTGFGVAPLKIIVGSKEFKDDGTIDLEFLQKMLDNEKGKTGTACPSVDDWKSIMEKGDNVIAITISGSVSGSCQSAVIARDMILETHPDKNIFVLDTLSGSGSMTFLERKAAQLIGEGKDFGEISSYLAEASKKTRPFFMLQNVDNLISNGRISPIVGRAVKTLKLCLIATVSKDGELEVINKTRDFNKAMDRCADEILKRGYKGKNIIISHCLNPKGAEIFKDKILKKYPDACVEIMKTSLLCGYYVEKGGIIASIED